MRHALVVLAFLLAACSGGSDDDVTLVPTSAPEVATTTTERQPIRRSPDVTAPLPTPGEPLTDGRHFTYVQATDVEARTVTVDVAQWLSGEEANAAYAEETGDTSGVPNDYYIRNTSTEGRTLPVADDVVVTFALSEAGPGEFSGTFGGIDDYVAERFTNLFWITVEGGIVVRLDNQYTP